MKFKEDKYYSFSFLFNIPSISDFKMNFYGNMLIRLPRFTLSLLVL